MGENSLEGKFVLFPNPVREIIQIAIPNTISTEKITATVFSITGTKLMEKTWNQPQQKLEIKHNLSSGIYLLKLDNGRSIQTLKMVVE